MRDTSCTKEGAEAIREAVRHRYGDIARTSGCGCGPGCCGDSANPELLAQKLGYSAEDILAVPGGANMGLGCGNPQAIANLRPGEVVLDLGSGGGFDCFLAARRVGENGYIIGIDMTPEMVAKSRANATAGNYRNVEFRLGEIETIPAADNSVDCVISNCVVNLSPDKQRVFAEVFRVLKPGGRLAVSDVVATTEMPQTLKQDVGMLTSCVAGASLISDLERMLTAVGFEAVSVRPEPESRSLIRDWAPGTDVADYVISAVIEAVKPASNTSPTRVWYGT